MEGATQLVGEVRKIITEFFKRRNVSNRVLISEHRKEMQRL